MEIYPWETKEEQGKKQINKKQTCLQKKCRNTSALDIFQFSVIYGDVDNENVTKIHDLVYLNPRVGETENNQ